MGLSTSRDPLRPGPFGWPGALVVGAVVLVGAWAVTGTLWQAGVGGATAAVTWYGVHRLAERLAAAQRDGTGRRQGR